MDNVSCPIGLITVHDASTESELKHVLVSLECGPVGDPMIAVHHAFGIHDHVRFVLNNELVSHINRISKREKYFPLHPGMAFSLDVTDMLSMTDEAMETYRLICGMW